MLVRMALDMTALTDDFGGDRSRRISAHRTLIEAVKSYGIIVQEDESEAFLSAIRELPQSVRDLWLTAYSQLRQQLAMPPAPLGLHYIDDVVALDANWAGKTDVAVAEQDRALIIGVPEEQAYLISDGGIEVVRFDLLYESATLRRLVLLSQSRIRANVRREAVWNERFNSRAKYAKYVVICDRYAGLDLVRHYESNGTIESGLRWILHRIELSGTCYVSLILAAEEGNEQVQVAQAVTRLASELKRRKIRDIKLSLASDRVFMHYGHDRHLRFDHHVYALGQGMKLFSEPLTAQISDCFCSEDKAAQDKEDALRRKAYLRDSIIPLP